MGEVARGRKTDPSTKYRIHIRKDKEYQYASTFALKESKKGTGSHMCYVNWGRIENNIFIPNEHYINTSLVERAKLIFPPDIDVHLADELNEVEPTILKDLNTEQMPQTASDGRDSAPLIEQAPFPSLVMPELSEMSEKLKEYPGDHCVDKLYGHVWLLEQWAIKRGVFDDLMTVFNNDYGKASDILSLAIYSIVENRSFVRINRWRVTHKIMSDRDFSSGYITRFTQSIGESHRMKYLECRVKRQAKDTTLSSDSTTQSGNGRYLVDLRWGHNKDDVNHKCSVEAFVYARTTHETVYYRRFSGNTNDMITISTIIKDLENDGFSKDSLLFTSARGHSGLDNMAQFVRNECSFITCAEVNCKPVTDTLLNVNYDAVGYATNLEYDKELGMFYGQFYADEYAVMMDDGSLFPVTGIKVNVYYDPKDRQAEITSVHCAIDAEKKAAAKIRAGLIKVCDVSGLKGVLKHFFSVTEIKNRQGKGGTPEKVKDSSPESDERFHAEFGDRRYIVEFDANKEKIAYAKCGFFASCMYKLDVSPLEALQYVSGDEHDMSFFCLKDDENEDKQEYATEGSQIGRSFIYFVGNTLQSSAEFVWKQKLSDEFSSFYEVLDAMESIRYTQHPEHSCMTLFTNEQVSICQAFGIEPPFECLPSAVKESLRKKAVSAEEQPSQEGCI